MVETMTELVIRSYKAADGVELYIMLGAKDNMSDIRRWAEDAETNSIYAKTVVYEGKVVASVGVVPQLDGVGRAWAMFTDNIGRLHIDPQIVKIKIKELMIEHKLRRLEATARVDHSAAASYLRYLGFKREGVMEKYEPDGTDAYLYAITR